MIISKAGCFREYAPGGDQMKLYIDQIPEGISWEEYPKGTEFILDDTRPRRDPVSFQLIRPPKRPLITPAEAWAAHRGDQKPE